MPEEILPDHADPIQKGRRRSILLVVIFALILLLGGFVLWQHKNSPFLSLLLGSQTATTTPASSTAPEFVGTATYTCNNGKSITAQFFATPRATVPTLGSVTITLSDGRNLSLPQTISASGIRYANTNETFVFWSKGNTAFIEEGATHEQTYQNCVSGDGMPAATQPTTPEDNVMPDSGVLPQ